MPDVTRRRFIHTTAAAVPDRGEPYGGEVDYRWLLRQFADAGYDGWIGAEYRPRGSTVEGLGWLDEFTRD